MSCLTTIIVLAFAGALADAVPGKWGAVAFFGVLAVGYIADDWLTSRKGGG